MPQLSLLSVRRRLTTVTLKFVSNNSNPVPLSVLHSCNSMEALKQVHAQLVATGRIKDTYVATKMVESYAVSARNMDYSSLVFYRIDGPDSYSWTTMIRGYLEAKNPEKAIEFYEEMGLRSVELNRFTFLFVLKAYGFKLCYKEGRNVHGKVFKMGFCFDVFILNALIGLYSKCGDICGARKVFDELPMRNVVNWNTMVSACFSCGDVQTGRRLFEEMPEKNASSWNAVIIGYSKLGHVEIAKSLFDVMPDKDLVSWSAMISGYVQSRRDLEALQLFDEMQSSGLSPDNVTLTSVLSACAQIGALDMGRWIHAFMKRKKLTDDVILGTCLLDMYAKCGCINLSVELFHNMPQRNLCSWNAVILGLATHGHGSTALELFKEMESAGMEPDDVTFIAVLSACSHIGSVDKGWRLFNQMEMEFKLTPKIEHYGCMVDILGRAGRINEATELIKNMPMEPNIVVWGALLNACKIHGYDIIEDVVGHLRNWDSGNGGCYTLLSNIFAGKHQWSEVETTRKVMREMERTQKKTPGCSSIEVNGVVHEFFAEAWSHSTGEKVSGVIKMLRTHLEVEGCVPTP